MKILKKSILWLLVMSITLVSMSVCINAQTEEEVMLTPAFNVLSYRQRSVKSGIVGEKMYFSLGDFEQALGVCGFEYIIVTDAPDKALGVLKVGSLTVGDGQKIYSSLLPMLEFYPASSEVDMAVFSFCGDLTTSKSEITYTLRLIEKLNYAPTSAGIYGGGESIEAVCGESVAGMLCASDPEGDDIKYEIVKYPKHGTITRFSSEDGVYTYTADTNYYGEDSFSFVAVDEYGNYTQRVDIPIKVKRAKR